MPACRRARTWELSSHRVSCLRPCRLEHGGGNPINEGRKRPPGRLPRRFTAYIFFGLRRNGLMVDRSRPDVPILSGNGKGDKGYPAGVARRDRPAGTPSRSGNRRYPPDSFLAVLAVGLLPIIILQFLDFRGTLGVWPSSNRRKRGPCPAAVPVVWNGEGRSLFPPPHPERQRYCSVAPCSSRSCFPPRIAVAPVFSASASYYTETPRDW